MDGVRVALEALDDAWSHPFESLQAALADLGEAEAEFQPAAWSAEPREEGWPAPGTVRWQIAHLAHCKRHYADIVKGLDAPAPAPRPRVALPTLAEELDALAAAHGEEREAFAGLRPADLELVAGGNMPMREFLAMATRHDSWHASQIVLLRRLFRAEGASA
ncbi:MAG: DinB family protein [Planctomycetota bacterium]